MAQHFNQTHTAGFNSNIKKEDLTFSEEYTSGACLCKACRRDVNALLWGCYDVHQCCYCYLKLELLKIIFVNRNKTVILGYFGFFLKNLCDLVLGFSPNRNQTSAEKLNINNYPKQNNPIPSLSHTLSFISHYCPIK